MSCDLDQLPVILLEALFHSLLDPLTNIVNAPRGSGLFLAGFKQRARKPNQFYQTTILNTIIVLWPDLYCQDTYARCTETLWVLY